MKKTLVSAVMLAGSLFTAAALADKGALEGTLVKMDATSVTIKTEKGEEKTFAMTEKTKKRGGEMAPGNTIEVYTSKDGKTAEMVELVRK